MGHVTVLDAALAQLPVDPAENEVIARADSAGCSHGFLDACRDRHVRFVVGHRLSADIASVLVSQPKRRWRPAVTADGAGLREHASAIEITEDVDLSGWPEGTRMIARREPCHPGAQLTFTDIDGHRYQVMTTDLEDGDISYLEALCRGRGRVEQRIADAKDTGLANLPSASFAINQAWLTLVLTAQDLLRWTQLLTLDGELATAEPNGSATHSCTPPASSSPPADNDSCDSRTTGPGPTNSSQRSIGSTRSNCAAEPSEWHPGSHSTPTAGHPTGSRTPVSTRTEPDTSSIRPAAQPRPPTQRATEQSGLGMG